MTTYSSPYMFASAVIAVNTEMVTEEITSYAKLTDGLYMKMRCNI